MSQLNREDEIRLGCLEQAALLFASSRPKIFNERDVVEVAKAFEIYVRGLYVKGPEVKRPER